MGQQRQKQAAAKVTNVEVAKPTISEVLVEFLADEKTRLAAKTYRQYESVVDLLKHSLNGYAYQYLDKSEATLLDRLGTEQQKEFCDVFGPEHILSNVSEFLDYFMVRKVMCGKDTLRAAGTMTKKLAVWLAEHGYANSDDAKDAAEQGAEAARNLPAADRLRDALNDFADGNGLDQKDEDISDHFTITAVEAGAIWLDAMTENVGKGGIGPVALPAHIAKQCKIGWSISGIVGQRRGKWRLVEAWNVYP